MLYTLTNVRSGYEQKIKKLIFFKSPPGGCFSQSWSLILSDAWGLSIMKRFTETTKWNDSWYRSLSSKHKCIWSYLCDQCDNAGVWKKDYNLASFFLNDSICDDDISVLNKGKQRVEITDKYLIIEDFIDFQIGDLNGDGFTNLQKNCIDLVRKHQDKGIMLTRKLPVDYEYATGIGKGKGNSKGNNKGKGDVTVRKLTKEEQEERTWEES